MGFGYLFLGFLFLAKAPYLYIDFLPDFIGFALMFTGIRTARRHCAQFDFTYFVCLCGILLSLIKFGAEIWFSVTETMSESFDLGFGLFYELFTLFFVSALLISVSGIAGETGLGKLSRRAKLHVVLTLLLAGASLAISLGLTDALGFSEEIALRLPLVASILSYLWVVLDAAVVFSCYMWICLEGDEDMEDNRKHRYKTPFDILDAGKTKQRTKRKR